MKEEKKRIGLALSGGGAKGAAHCGALQALKEYGIKPDVIAGCSAGSIVAALYAAGIEPVEMCNMFINKEFKDLLKVSVPKSGFFDQAPLIDYLNEILPVHNFDELNIPLYILATDLDAAKPIVFSEGDLAPRIMASCSIPVFFYPTIIDGTHYVDGGVFHNLPSSIIRNHCDTLFGVGVLSEPVSDYKKNILNVAIRSFSMMMLASISQDIKLCDHFVEINTIGCSQFDLGKISALFNRGYESMVNYLENNNFTRKLDKVNVDFKKQKRILLSPL
jgi:Predicted esterase of the alpha-beta hydrolase superfamily